MRIAYLAQSYPPMISGAAHVVEVLAQGMAKRGHHVLVIAASDNGYAYRIQEGHLAIVRLRSLHNPLRVRQRFLFYPQVPLLKILREFEPDIIHVHEPLQLSWFGLDYARKANVPAVLTIHQTPSIVASYLPDVLKDHMTMLLWNYARVCFKRFTSIVTPTQTISKLVTRMTDLQTKTISSGVDLEIFHPTASRKEITATRQKWNLPLSAPILLHVGRLDREKYVDRVLRAAAITLHHTDSHLVIVGDGSHRDHLLKLCTALGIAERVHFTGFVAIAEGLPEIYRAASLFVTASEIETQGIVLLEAAASGLPIVAVRATCIHEIVNNGINGYLAEPGDISAMADSMTLLLKNPSHAKRLGKASRMLAGKHEMRFTLDANEDLYRELARLTARKSFVALSQQTLG